MGTSHFSEAFRKQAVEKFLKRGGKSADDIAKELGVSTFSLYGWSKSMTRGHRSKSSAHGVDRFETLLSFVAMPQNKQGEFLRAQGLTTDQIDSWKKEIKVALDSKDRKTDRHEALQHLRRIKDLEKELNNLRQSRRVERREPLEAVEIGSRLKAATVT
jgi:transposase-like protein